MNMPYSPDKRANNNLRLNNCPLVRAGSPHNFIIDENSEYRDLRGIHHRCTGCGGTCSYSAGKWYEKGISIGRRLGFQEARAVDAADKRRADAAPVPAPLLRRDS